MIFPAVSRAGITAALVFSITPAAARGSSPVQQSAGPSCAARAVERLETLSLRQPVRSSLKRGEQNCFRLDLAVGQFVRIVAAPHDMDVAVALFGPEGQKLVEVSSLESIEGEAVLIRVAGKAGTHRVEVRPNDADTKPGSYAVEVTELRAGTPRDSKLVAAEDALTAGQKLFEAAEPEDLRAAFGRYDEAYSLFRDLGETERTSLALRRKGNVLAIVGQAPAGLRLLGEALQFVEQKYGPEHVRVVPVLWDLADAEKRAGDLPKARKTHERAQKIIEKSPAANSYAAARGLVAMANVLLSLGDQNGALAASHHATQICERRYGQDSAHVASTVTFEARVNQELLLLPQAQALYEQAIRNYVRRYGPEPPAIVYPLYALSQVRLDRGDADGAVAAHARAVRIVEQAQDKGSAALIQAHWGMGLLLHKAGRFADARAAHERMLAASRPRTRAVAIALRGIADTMLVEGNITGARAKYDEALELSKGIDTEELTTSLMAKASTYRAPGDYDEGRRLFEQALQLYEKHPGAYTKVAGVLSWAAAFDARHGRHAEARAKYRRAIELYEKGEGRDSPGAMALLRKLGNSFVQEKRYEEALAPLGRVLSVAEQTHGADHITLLEPLGELTGALSRLHRFDEARALLQRSAKIVADNGLSEELIATRSLNPLAAFLLVRGDYKASQEVGGRALSIYQKHPGHPDLEVEVGLRNALGMALMLDGQFVAARDLIEKTIDLSEKRLGPQSPEFIAALSNMANLLAAQGDVDSVSRYIARIQGYSQALAEVDNETAFYILNLTGSLAAYRKKTAEARELLKQAAARLEADMGADSPIVAQVVGGYALMLADPGGDYTGAEELLDKADEVLKRSKTASYERALPLLARGEIHRGRKKFPEARAAFEEAIRVLEERLGAQHYITSGALIDLGWLHHVQGDAPQARASFAKASGALYPHLRDVLPMLSLAEQRLFLEMEVPKLISGLLTSHQGRADFGAAYEVMMRLKGSLVDSMRHQTLVNRLDPTGPYGEQVKRLRQVRADIAGWHYRFNAATAAEWRQKNEELTLEKEKLEREVARALKPGDLSDPLAGGLRQFQRLLKRDEVFVDLYRYDYRGGDDKVEEHYAAVLTGPAGGPTIVDLGPAARINRAVIGWRNDVLSVVDAEPGWKALAALLWEPLEKALPAGARRVWLSPDGELARLPWQLLPASSRRMTGLLLTQTDSARELARLRQQRAAPVPRQAASILLAGDINYNAGLTPESTRVEGEGFRRLENTGTEVKAIGDIGRRLKAEVNLLMKEAASKASVVEGLQKVGYAHLATHGFLSRRTEEVDVALKVVARQMPLNDAPRPNMRNPLVESGIALAGANVRAPFTLDSGGLLTAEEIVGLDLSRCELVTLSACETGRGEEVTGQGVMGLRASVMAAGSRSMLMSLWKVPDEATVKFMEAFYDNLWVKKLSKAEALLRAQEAVRDHPSGKYREPINWAAWVLAGEAW